MGSSHKQVKCRKRDADVLHGTGSQRVGGGTTGPCAPCPHPRDPQRLPMVLPIFSKLFPQLSNDFLTVSSGVSSSISTASGQVTAFFLGGQNISGCVHKDRGEARSFVSKQENVRDPYGRWAELLFGHPPQDRRCSRRDRGTHPQARPVSPTAAADTHRSCL